MMAPCARTLRIWHLAGHASQALAFQIPVELLTLDGFTETDLERDGHPQRLDEGTLLNIPVEPRSWGRPVGVQLMERLMLIAMGGPVLELINQNLPCTLERLQMFPVDWMQAWNAAGDLWPEAQGRARVMSRFLGNAPNVLRDGPTSYFVNFVHDHLMVHRRMEADAIRSAWEEAHAKYEKSTCQTYRSYRFTESDLHESIGELLIPPEWRSRDRLSPP